jgi:hypothetical protein
VTQTLPERPELAAARLMLERMGISLADLLDVAPARPSAPTFAAYVPVVAAAVSPGTRRVYGSYWKRVVQAWGLNSRCSILFHFEVPGGRWHTVMSRPVSAARAASSVFHARVR